MITFVPLLLAAALTPMNPGFHQQLKCTPQGYVTIDVAAADPKFGPHAALVTTTLAAGPSLAKTQAIRALDAHGNILAFGYVLQPGVVKRFPRRLLLPAAPPVTGERSSYFNVSGVVVDKHFEGTQPARDAQGRPATGFVFSDYYSGRKLNAIVYVPGTGITAARFFGVPTPSGELDCRL